jgi:hypothetical protein
VQQEIHGHRGRKGDPLYRVRNILRAGEEHLTDRQRARFVAAWSADRRAHPKHGCRRGRKPPVSSRLRAM